MKRFLTVFAALAFLGNEPVPLAALEIRRVEKAAAFCLEPPPAETGGVRASGPHDPALPPKLRLFSQVFGACGGKVHAVGREDSAPSGPFPSQVHGFPEKMQKGMGTRSVKRSFDRLATGALR